MYPDPNKTAKTSPNVLLIVTDDLGYGDLSCHGNPIVDTPVLDQLAGQGAHCDKFYVSAVCSPSRASFLTGRYYPRTGVSNTGRGYEMMNLHERTLADMLQSAGYATGCFGKWHNGSYFPYTPTGRGFDEFLGFSAGYINRYFDAVLDSHRGPQDTQGYIIDVLTSAADQFITDNRDKPWFCYLPYNTPHLPFQAPDSFFDKYREKSCDDALAAVYAMVESTDAAIGRLLARIDELDLTKDTIVIFTSDHGPNTPRYNAGLRGAKASVHEGGLRVPFFVRWPGQIAPDTELTSVSAHIDLVPTLLELVGEDSDVAFDGCSFAPVLLGEESGLSERLLFDFWDDVGTVRSANYRLVLSTYGPCELYDIISDPAETINLIGGQGQNPADEALAARLQLAYNVWAKDVQPGRTERPPIPIGHLEVPSVALRSLSAAVTGSLRLQSGWGSQSWYGQWTDITSTLVWDIDVIHTGRHTVSLRYTCTPGDEGSLLEITVGDQKVTSTLTQPFVPEVIETYDRVLPRKGPPEQTWGELQLGILNFVTGPEKITLRALEMPGKAVAEFWALDLRRIDE
jgi:arylsulfatase A-like enzyme